MKNWITPNTIILLVLIIALIHLHACTNRPHQKSQGDKNISKNTKMESASAASQSTSTLVYATFRYTEFVNNKHLRDGEDSIRAMSNCNNWRVINATGKFEK